MQEIISRILEGNFDYENGSLDFSCTKIEISLQRGEDYEGAFEITSDPSKPTDGYIYTTDLRMTCLQPEFSGSSMEIPFRFDGRHTEEGDVIKGFFNVISNHGEYYLPFVISVKHSVLESSIGPIKNLFHFANLAKSNWQEAVAMFYSPEFPSILVGSDAQYRESYRGLSVYPGQEQNMEEFLILVNKKQKVEFLVQEDKLSAELSVSQLLSDEAVEIELPIVRNGWGYTALNVECEGDFLFAEKEFLNDDDFLRNHCRLPIYIDCRMCRPGKNYGKVYLFNSFVSLEVPVVVKVGENPHGTRVALARKRRIVQLVEYYLAFRLKKINSTTWQKETAKLISWLLDLDENDMTARLFQAQLLITEERYNEAGWMLEHVGEVLEQRGQENAQDAVCYAYYLYLTTLVNPEESYVDSVTAEVSEIYRHNRRCWQVAWLLLFLSEEYNKSASSKWMFLKKQFTYGCTSPVLYCEALFLINNNPALLREIGDFELQVLNFGARQEFLSAETVEQLLYLLARNREYSPTLRRILERIYARKKDERVLQELCSLFVRGGKVGKEYFEWYRAGVEAQLRITNLYEYYMMSLDLESSVALPKTLLLYFSYRTNLDYEHSAYLYAYVYEHQEDYPEIYENYRARIEHFVLDQIQKEHINRHLAYLYRRLLTHGMVNEQTYAPLSRLIFANRLQVEDSRLHKVYVYHPGCIAPRESLLQGRETWVALYGNEYTIVFEDGFGNRFVKNVEYTLEKLLLPSKFIRMLEAQVSGCTELNLYLLENGRCDLDDNRAAIAMGLAASENVEPSVRKELQRKLLQYYYEADDMRGTDSVLQSIELEQWNNSERGEVLRYMVLRGMYDEAYDCLAEYGPYLADAKSLVRLVGELITRREQTEDPVLLYSSMYAFKKGKYSSDIIRYLVRYFNGLTKELRDVWKAAESFDVDCYELCEKILVQMLYSGTFVGEKMDIFRRYISQGAKPEVEEAFLAQCAYDFFVNEKLTEGEVFQEVRNMYLRGENVQWVCRLAYLKYYAENPAQLGEDQLVLCREFLGELLTKRIHMNFMRAFEKRLDFGNEFTDKTIIEYRCRPGVRARIHYVVMRENGEADEYKSEYMQEICGGVCVKEFVLFFGESLQYYIMEESEEGEQLTESGTLQKSDMGSETADCRYEMINDILISKTLQDYETLDSLLEEYVRKEYLAAHLFTLQ